MAYDAQVKAIREKAKELLESGAVDTVLGFTEGPVDGAGVPVFVTQAAEVDKLVWGKRCVANLAGYLSGRPGKTAIVAKPCDVRAIVNLVIENQVKRDDVHIIGVDCPGMENAEGQALRACADCRVNIAPVYDTRVEDKDVKPRQKDTAKLEKGLNENLERFTKEMEKCILCFSCRQACYGCYCQTCFMDRGVPSWQPASPDMGAKMIYHLGRAMHLAGRCVECGACENACASGVDVRYLIREVTGFVDELYGFTTGMDLETQPAMLTYKMEDREVGFLGGEAHG